MKHSKFTYVLAVFWLAFVLSGCQSDGFPLSEDLVEPTLQLDEVDNPNPVDGTICPPSILFNPGWTVMPATQYHGYDLVVRIDPNLLPIPGPNCFCREYRYCLNMNIRRTEVEEIAVLDLDDPAANPQILEAYAHAPEGVEVPPMEGDLPTEATFPEFHQQCIPPNRGMLVMLRLNAQPSGSTLSHIIVNAVGICIVDNVPDEEG